MNRLKQIYLTVFTLFFRAAADSWTASINAWKGVVGVTMIEWAIIVAVNAWLQWWLGTKLLFGLDKWAFYALFLLSFGVNYYALITRGFGIQYEQDFSALPKRERTSRLVIGISTVVVIVGLLVVSFYTARPGALR